MSKSRFTLSERPDFMKMPRKVALALMRTVAAVFSFVQAPDCRDPFVVWAQARMYNEDVPVEEMTEEERLSTPACFPLAPETDAEWWSRHHERNIRQKTVKGPWIKNRKKADWSKDNSYAATMANAMRVEFQAQIAKTDGPAEKARLKEMYEKEKKFFGLTTLGIETPMDLPYLYAHGGCFQLTVEFTYVKGTEALPYNQRKVDTSVPPKYHWSFQVPVLNEHGEVTETLDVWHYSEAKNLIERQTAEGKYRYDKRFPSFRGIPLVTNTFPKHPKAAADAKPKQFQDYLKTRMGLDTGKMNRKAEERSHLVKEAKRVLSLLGFKTHEAQTAEVDKAVVNRVKKALIHWKHNVRYSDKIGDDAIETEFDVKHIWSQYYACQMALQTASAAELASGTVQTPKKGGSLVWTLVKNEKGEWNARLDRAWKEQQTKLKKFRSMSQVTQKAQVAEGGSKSGGFAALEVDVDLSKGATKPAKPMKGFKAAAKRGQEATPVCPVARAPEKKKKTRAQQRKENKANKKAASLAAYRAATMCKFGMKCGNPACGFKHPEGAETPEERKANQAAFKAEQAAKKAAKKASKIEIELPGLDEEEDVAGPAEEPVQERTSVTEEELEAVREKMRAEMQAQLEAEMKAQIEAEREKMRQAIREQMMAEEEEKQKKNREHQAKVKAGGFSKGFEMPWATTATKTTTEVAPALPTGPRLSKGMPMRLGPQMRLGPKVLRADKSSKA